MEMAQMSRGARVPLALWPVLTVAACRLPYCVMAIPTVWMLQMRSPVWVRSLCPASSPLGTPSQGPAPEGPCVFTPSCARSPLEKVVPVNDWVEIT